MLISGITTALAGGPGARSGAGGEGDPGGDPGGEAFAPIFLGRGILLY